MNNWRGHVMVDRGKRLTREIIGYWAFDDGAGSTVRDVSGHNLNGTWQGTLGSQWSPAGLLGGCGNFDGTTTWVNVANTAQAGCEAISFSCWVNFTAISAASYHLLGDLAMSGNETFWGTTGAPFWELRVPTGAADVTSQAPYTAVPVVPPVGVWQHYVGVEEGWAGRYTIYVNGVQVARYYNAAAWGTGAPTAQFAIGSRRGTTLMAQGLIDEVGLWRRGLSAREVAVLYNGGLGLKWPLHA